MRVLAAGADGRVPLGQRRALAHAAPLGLRDTLHLPRAQRGMSIPTCLRHLPDHTSYLFRPTT